VKYLSEALSRIGVLSLRKLCSRMDVVKRRYLFDLGLPDLSKHLFLLFTESLRINLGQPLFFDNRFRRIILLLLRFTFKLSKLLEFFFFFSLLLRVNICCDPLPLRLGLWLVHHFFRRVV